MYHMKYLFKQKHIIQHWRVLQISHIFVVFPLLILKNRLDIYNHAFPTSIHQPIQCQCCCYIETSKLTCTANQLTGFYMRETLTLNETNTSKQIQFYFWEEPVKQKKLRQAYIFRQMSGEISRLEQKLHWKNMPV